MEMPYKHYSISIILLHVFFEHDIDYEDKKLETPIQNVKTSDKCSYPVQWCLTKMLPLWYVETLTPQQNHEGDQ